MIIINIKKLRKKAKITQKEMSELLKITRATYLRYEKKPEKIPVGTYYKIVDIIQNYHDNYSTCNCEICQVGRKYPEVQYAYYYAEYYFAKYVLDILKKQKVKFSFEKLADKTGDYLNELGCVCQDTLACGEYMEEMERDYPKLKNFIKKRG